MNKAKRKQIFISYAHEDLETVKSIVQGLKKRELHIWFDKEDIGTDPWRPQIEKAISRSRFFIICISKAALKKTGDEPGFQDEELNKAYKFAESLSTSDFTIVPVRLEDCERGDFRTISFQQYDLFPDFKKGLDKLAVHLGGVSLSDTTAQDERTEAKKIIEGLLGKANAAIFAQDFETALTILNSILVLDLNNIVALISKGVVLVGLDRFEEALPVLDKALELNPDSVIAWFGKSVILNKLGRFDEALPVLDKLLELNPDSADSWNSKGIALHYLGRHEEALQAYEKSLELGPDDAVVWNNKGNALYNLGRSEEAQIAFKKSSELGRKHK